MLVYDLGASGGGAPSLATSLADRLQPPPPPAAVAAPAVPGTNAAAPLLGWKDRVRVGAEVAAGVAFLHAQSPPVFCRS